jgi:hypothetical protein
VNDCHSIHGVFYTTHRNNVYHGGRYTTSHAAEWSNGTISCTSYPRAAAKFLEKRGVIPLIRVSVM